MSTLNPLAPFAPSVIALADGTLVRVRRVTAPDLLFDVVSLVTAANGDTPAVYATLAAGQAVPALPDFDPATAEAWPDDGTLAAWITSQLPTDASRLADAKAALRAVAQGVRTVQLASGFTYADKTIQTRNNVDIANINGAALRAVNDASFTTTWITADNSFLPLDHAGVIAMQAAMIDRGNAIFGAYAVITGIIAAADQAALDALAPYVATLTVPPAPEPPPDDSGNPDRPAL